MGLHTSNRNLAKDILGKLTLGEGAFSETIDALSAGLVEARQRANEALENGDNFGAQEHARAALEICEQLEAAELANPNAQLRLVSFDQQAELSDRKALLIGSVSSHDQDAGSSAEDEQAYLPEHGDTIRSFLSGDVKQVVMLPFATSNREEQIAIFEKARARFEELGYELVIPDDNTERARATISTAQAFFVPDGDTSHLVNKLSELGLTDDLFKIIHSGVPYIGIGAGAQLAFERSIEIGADDWKLEGDGSALRHSIIPGANALSPITTAPKDTPTSESDPKVSANRLQRAVLAYSLDIVALPQNGALLLQDGKLSIKLSDGDSDPVQIWMADGSTRKIAVDSGGELNFLITQPSISAETAANQYATVTVNTTEIIRKEADRYAPDNADLVVQACDCLMTAIDAAHEIYLEQFDPMGKRVLQTLRLIGEHVDDVESRLPGFNELISAIERNGSTYDCFTGSQILPRFDFASLEELYREVEEKGELAVPIRKAEALELVELESVLFDISHAPTRAGSLGIHPWQLGVLPPHAAKELIEKISADDKAGSPYTVARLNQQGEPEGIPYIEAYEEQIAVISKYVQLAAAKFRHLADVIGDAEKSEALKLFANYLETEVHATETLEGEYPYVPADRARLETFQKAGALPFFACVIFGETYSDPSKIKMDMRADLAIETDETRELGPLMERLQDLGKLEAILPLEASRRANINAMPPLLIRDIVYRGAYSRAGTQASATTFDSKKKEVREEGEVVVLWRNSLAANVDAAQLRIAREVLPQDVIDRFGDRFEKLLQSAIITGVVAHEATHRLGEQMEKGELTKPDKLGGSYEYISEGHGESGRLFLMPALIPDEGLFGLSKDEIINFIYETHAADLIRHTRLGRDNAYGRAAMIRLNYLEKNNAITIEDDRIHIPDQERFESCIRELFELHQDLMMRGDADQLSEFLGEYDPKVGSKIDLFLTRTHNKLDQMGIAKSIALEYQREDLDLAA